MKKCIDKRFKIIDTKIAENLIFLCKILDFLSKI